MVLSNCFVCFAFDITICAQTEISKDFQLHLNHPQQVVNKTHVHQTKRMHIALAAATIEHANISTSPVKSLGNRIHTQGEQEHSIGRVNELGHQVEGRTNHRPQVRQFVHQ